MPEKYFEPGMSPDDVKRKVTEGVEPLQYFEFEFYNTFVQKVTYDDGTSTSDSRSDPIISKEIRLKGLLVDVSPHLIRGRLFAGEIRVVDFILGKLNVAVQSDLFRTVRSGVDAGARMLPLSADFESALYETHDLENEFVKEENSRFIREVQSDSKLKLYYNVNSFSFDSLKGKVYGYLGPSIPIEHKDIRIHGRRLLINPSIPAELKQDFRIDEQDLEPVDNIERNDLECSYEIIEEKRLAILRYLNSVPFQDYNHSPPKDYNFSIALVQDGKKVETSSSDQITIELDNEDSISRNGGIHVFSIPENVRELDKLSIEVKVQKNGSGNQHSFLVEPKYDFILNDNQKFIISESGEKHKQVIVRVYEKNRVARDDSIQLILKTEKNKDSPTVALWSDVNTTTKNGLATCFIESIDLEKCKDGIEDPVLTRLSGGTKPVKISGELPWDRHYGNYLSLRIQSTERPVIKMNFPVRVLHRVQPQYLENIDNLDKETIQDILTKILGYYTRNYPWLHVQYRYVKDNEDGLIKPAYNQFLRIKEYLDFTSSDHIHDWHSVQGSVSKINHFLDRLDRDDSNWRKMPRSRDFPVNGTEFLKVWKASLINKLIQGINESKVKILQDDNNNNDSGLENDIDINDWQEVETIVNELDDLIGSSSLAPEHKKTLLRSKMTLYNYMLEKLSMAKLQTGHSHGH
jgi:hypothetical protein